MTNIKINDIIWYFKSWGPIDYVDTIKNININRSKVLNVKMEPQYHNFIEYIYTLENGETISSIIYNIYNDEDKAIEEYNSKINKTINKLQCSVSELNRDIKDLSEKIIKIKLL